MILNGDFSKPGARSRVLHESSRDTASRSSLVGREQELVALEALLERRWHVTIVGTAGIGKTRLASEALARRGGTSFFCDLTQSVDADDVLNSVARVLAVEPGEGSAVDRIAAVLAAHAGAYLLLDGVDRLAATAWDATISRFLDACPELHVLVTARSRLRAEGEAVFPLGPLEVAAEEGACSQAELLFLGLAEGVLGRDLRENGAVPDDVRSLVRVLDGIPLALEIAASALNVLSPLEFLQRGAFLLDARVTGKSWAGGSLRAAFEVSWERLPAHARRALQAFSVFVGDFDLVAAEAIVGPGAIELLARLCEASLVSSSVQGHRTRFRLFECVRQFATDRGASAEILAEAHDKHALFFGTAASEWMHRGESGERLLAIDWLFAEESNLVAIAQRAVEHGSSRREGDIEPAAGALAGLAWLWIGRGPLAPHVRLLDQMESRVRPGVLQDSRAVATFLLALVHVWRHRGDFERAALVVEDTIERARHLALPYFLARCLLEKARLVRLRGNRDGATSSLEEAAAIAESTKDDVLRVHVILSRRLVSSLDEAALEEASRLARSVGDPLVTARVELAFGTLCYAEGRTEEALEHLWVVDQASEALRQHTWRALAGIVAGNALAEQGRFAEARTTFERSQKIGSFTAHRRCEAEACGNIALLDFEAGKLAEAAEGLVAATGLFSKRDPMRFFFLAALAGVEASQPERVGVAVERFVNARNEAEKLAPSLAAEVDLFGEMFRLTEAKTAAPVADGHRPTAAALGAARVARRVRESIRTRLASSAFTVGRDATWFRPPMGAAISLVARPVLCALLRELIIAHLASPSEAVTREHLMRTIWPDERSSPRSMGNRLSVAISTLRSLGLRALIATSQGISLDPSVSVLDKHSTTSPRMTDAASRPAVVISSGERAHPGTGV